MKKITKYTIIVLMFSISALFIWLNTPQVEAKSLPLLKNGDLVFQTTNTPQATAIILASNSLYSHMGMIKIDDHGNPLVVEAVGPVREISLDKWIQQGIGGRITVKRIKGLTPKQAEKSLASARRYYGKPYDFLFQFDQKAIYCSELIYYAFKHGAQLTLGNVERVNDLNINNFLVKKLIKQRWQKHPMCKNKKAKDFDSCYKIILQQKLITPESIAKDNRLETIFSNY